TVARLIVGVERNGLRLRDHRRRRPGPFLPKDSWRDRHPRQRTRHLHRSVEKQAMTSLPPGPKGKLITGVMREFNRDMLAFITRCHREYGDVVRSRFLYVHA